MDLIFAYLAGLLTLINPCVLPVLPIVLASAAQGHRLGPVALTAGLSTSFAALGLTITAFGPAIGLNADRMAQLGAALMVAFGLVLLMPRLNAGFATATAGLAARADARIDDTARHGLAGQAAAGALLGAVWSPCIGPTLGGAIGLASQGQGLAFAGAVMLAFALGVSSVMLALAYGARATLLRRRAAMMRLAQASKPLMGAVLLTVGLALLFNLHHRVEAWALQILPAWMIDLSVSL
jgi:cytochrome c biogenesis protein CcdA